MNSAVTPRTSNDLRVLLLALKRDEISCSNMDTEEECNFILKMDAEKYFPSRFGVGVC